MKLLSEIIPHHAKTQPDGIAFRDPQHAVTYGEMGDKTARLARFLQDRGVEEGDRVAICMQSSVLTGICVHGVFRSGAAFVPIDPEAPVDRIKTILSNCGVRVILAEKPQRAKLLEACDGLDVRVLVGTDGGADPEVTWNEVWTCAGDPAAVSQDPEKLAYILYTSGSTGTPKGIAHCHRSAMAYAANAADMFDVTPDDKVATTAPLSFDVATFAYLAAPYAGATTVVIPQAHARMPASLAKLLESEGVTIFYTVASALVQLVERGKPEAHDLSALRWVKFCGEPLPPVHLGAAMNAIPQAWFSNVYGPSEVNQCTCYNIAPGTDPAVFNGQIPIGDVWAHTQGLVLDGDTVVAPGEEGELAIASRTMMLEYWGRPDLNKNAHYVDDDGTRYYRTGDVVRRNDDGDYVMVGRVDRQVKVRGYRVELDEIELHLAEHPSVREAGVFPVMDGDKVAEIGAAVLVNAPQDDLRKTLLKFLATRLPSYAIPTHFDLAETLPRTSSGKIDRRRLSIMASSTDKDGK